ncbi:hypothetical protein ACE2AJ_18005 [Aquihabitans daechungensis]|uniref:hypothetical protein n=1 Tax=Aquihabitans daechungensis TaxID=1052257 RepID=UPI003BA0C0BE
MPDPTDSNEPVDPALAARLSHLAPDVDADAATDAFARHRAARARRRRTAIGSGIAAAVLVLAGISAALARPDDDGQQVLAGSTTEVPPSSVTVPVGLGQDERRSTTEDRGLTLSMDTPLTAEVGERMWIDVTLTNRRSEAITVGPAASCREPLAALAGSIEAVNAVEADTGFGAFDVDPPAGSGLSGENWEGEIEQLPSVLDAGVSPKVRAGRSQDQLTTSFTACDAMLLPPEEVAPGASITRRIAIDLRWVGHDLVDGQSLDVLASTGPIQGADGSDLAKVSVRQPVRLLDPVDRRASYDAAVAPDGIAAAPTLTEWVAMTGELPHRPRPAVLRGDDLVERCLGGMDPARDGLGPPGRPAADPVGSRSSGGRRRPDRLRERGAVRRSRPAGAEGAGRGRALPRRLKLGRSGRRS